MGLVFMSLVKSKKKYKNGKLEGEYFYYYSNGKLWIKNNYKEGMLHGEREVYFDNGRLEKKERYEKGFNLSRSFH